MLTATIGLALAGTWVLVSQVVGLSGASGAAASVGVARADLWARAMADAAQRGRADDVAAAAERWAAVSPVSSEAWLSLAEGLPASEAARLPAVLAIAFATGPGQVAQIPRRLLVAAGSSAITDGAIESYVRSDIRYIVTREPRLEQALRDADLRATPVGRYRLRAIVADIAPTLAASLPTY